MTIARAPLKRLVYGRIVALFAILLIVLVVAVGMAFNRVRGELDKTLNSLVLVLPNAVALAYVTNNNDPIDLIRREIEKNQGVEVLMVSADGHNMLTNEKVDARVLAKFNLKEPINYIPGDSAPDEIGTMYFRYKPSMDVAIWLVAAMAAVGVLALLLYLLRVFLDREVVHPIGQVVAGIQTYTREGFQELRLPTDFTTSQELFDLCREAEVMDISLQEAHQRLKEQVTLEARARVASDYYHLLKNKLLLIGGPVELIQFHMTSMVGPETDARVEIEALCGSIADAVEEMRATVDSMKEYAVDQAPVRPVVRPVNVMKIADLLHRDFVRVGMESSIQVELELDPGSATLQAMGDRGIIYSALFNLLKNAVDALGRAKVLDPQIVIRVLLEGDSVVLHVEDNGPGLPDLVMRQFLLGRKVESLEGWGVGLMYIRDNIPAIGGHVTCESVTPRGTRFVITLEAANVGQPA